MTLVKAELERFAMRKATVVTTLGMAAFGLLIFTILLTEPTAVMMPYVLLPGAVVTGVGVGMLGSTFIGAEIASGSLSTWLLFRPGRIGVFMSKLIAVALGSLAIGILLLGGLSILGGLFRSSDISPLENLGVLARCLLLVVMLGVGGFALGALLRSSAAFAIALAGYFALSVFVGPFLPWQATSLHPAVAVIEFLGSDLSGFDWDDGTGSQPLHWTAAGAYLLALLTIVVALAAARFARSDQR